MLSGAPAPGARTPGRVSCVRCGQREVDRPNGMCGDCEAAERRGRRLAALRVARSSIPPAFRDLDEQEVRSRTSLSPDIMIQAQQAMSRSRLVLVGRSGFGKTTLACWLLGRVIEAGVDGGQEAFDHGRRARFVDAPSLCRAVRDHPFGHGRAPLVTQAVRASVLVLDDVGQELEMRLADNPVVEVVRELHAAGGQTWVTTFLVPEAFEEAYGSGTARRVFDRAAVIALGATAPARRSS
jgi:DNA replication protein DnaC